MRIKPFRGYRYAGGERDLSRVVAPPYDQISSEMQDRLYAMSPDNIVRMTFAKEQPGADKYEWSRAALADWLARGVWQPEERPAIYPYHQTYTVGGKAITRQGFIALGQLTDYAEKVVLPHERTHASPKEDRLRLLQATTADSGLLFMLVSDPDGLVARATAPIGEPVAEARDLKGEVHRLWRLTDEAAIGEVQAAMANKAVIIADGHHRYESAAAYARQHPDAGYKMMAFCGLEAPGLTILANHRLVHHLEGFTLAGLVRAAAPWFTATPLPDPMTFKPTNSAIGVVAGYDAVVLTLRDDAFVRIDWRRGTSRAWRQLAVSILHEGLLRPLCGITEERLEARSHVDYTADQAEAVSLARGGPYQAAFLIAPTTPQELQAVVRGGEVLPQKSTHFYPKLLDGLVFHKIGD